MIILYIRNLNKNKWQIYSGQLLANWKLGNERLDKRSAWEVSKQMGWNENWKPRWGIGKILGWLCVNPSKHLVGINCLGNFSSLWNNSRYSSWREFNSR